MNFNYDFENIQIKANKLFLNFSKNIDDNKKNNNQNYQNYNSNKSKNVFKNENNLLKSRKNFKENQTNLNFNTKKENMAALKFNYKNQDLNLSPTNDLIDNDNNKPKENILQVVKLYQENRTSKSRDEIGLNRYKNTVKYEIKSSQKQEEKKIENYITSKNIQTTERRGFNSQFDKENKPYFTTNCKRNLYSNLTTETDNLLKKTLNDENLNTDYNHQRTTNSNNYLKAEKEVKINQKILHYLNSKNTRNSYLLYKNLAKNSYNSKESIRASNKNTVNNWGLDEEILKMMMKLDDLKNMTDKQLQVYLKNLFMTKTKTQVRAIIKNLKNTTKADFYSEVIVNGLINKKRFSYFFSIKENEIFYSDKEYLKKLYKRYETTTKINKIAFDYKNYLDCFCKPVLTNFKMNKFMKKNSDEKGEVYYLINYGDFKEEEKDVNEKDLHNVFFTTFLRDEIHRAEQKIDTNLNEENYFENLCVFDNYFIDDSLDYNIYKLDKPFLENYQKKVLSNIKDEQIPAENTFISKFESELKRKSKIMGYSKYKNDSFFLDLGKIQCNFILIEDLEAVKAKEKKIDFFFKKKQLYEVEINHHQNLAKPKRKYSISDILTVDLNELLTNKKKQNLFNDFKEDFDNSILKITNYIQDPRKSKLFGIDINTIKVFEKTLNNNYQNYRELENEKFQRIHPRFFAMPILNRKKINNNPEIFTPKMNQDLKIHAKTAKNFYSKNKSTKKIGKMKNRICDENYSINSSNAISIDKNDFLKNYESNEKYNSLTELKCLRRTSMNKQIQKHKDSHEPNNNMNNASKKLEVKVFDLSKNFLNYKLLKTENKIENLNYNTIAISTKKDEKLKRFSQEKFDDLKIINSDKNKPKHNEKEDQSCQNYNNILMTKFSNKILTSNFNTDSDKNQDRIKIIEDENVKENNDNFLDLKKIEDNYVKESKLDLPQITHPSIMTNEEEFCYIKSQNTNISSNGKENGRNNNRLELDLMENKTPFLTIDEKNVNHKENDCTENYNNGNKENKIMNNNLLQINGLCNMDCNTNSQGNNTSGIFNLDIDKKSVKEPNYKEKQLKKKLLIEPNKINKKKSPSVQLNNKISIIDTKVISSIYNKFNFELNEKILKLRANKSNDLKTLFKKIKVSSPNMANDLAENKEEDSKIEKNYIDKEKQAKKKNYDSKIEGIDKQDNLTNLINMNNSNHNESPRNKIVFGLSGKKIKNQWLQEKISNHNKQQLMSLESKIPNEETIDLENLRKRENEEKFFKENAELEKSPPKELYDNAIMIKESLKIKNENNLHLYHNKENNNSLNCNDIKINQNNHEELSYKNKFYQINNENINSNKIETVFNCTSKNAKESYKPIRTSNHNLFKVFGEKPQKEKKAYNPIGFVNKDILHIIEIKKD